MTPSSVRRVRGSAALLVMAFVAACDGPSRTPTQLSPGGPVQSKEVRLKDTDAVLMVRTPSAPEGERGGTSLLLDAGIFSKKGKVHPNKQEKFYEWTTSNPAVVTVDSTGLVSAVGVGNAFVIVNYKDMADTIDIAVIPVPVASVQATGPDSLSLDDTASYTAVTLDSVGVPLTGRTVTWSSSAPAALAVDASTGVGIALAEGTAIVTAASEGKSASVTTKVWLQPVASIEVTPSVASIALYRGTVTFTATLRDRRGKVLTGRVLTWSSSSTATFTVDPLSGAATTLAPGAGDAIAESEGVRGLARLTVTNPVEARALWVNRFEYTDAASIRTIMINARTANFNVVYFQARAAGDAFYKSTIEPCAIKICGKLGGATANATPTLDPLAVAVAEATPRGIEVHAWLNAYTGWVVNQCATLIESTPRHMLKSNPEWLMTDRNGVGMSCTTSSEYIWVSPGYPGVRTRLARVAADIGRRYGVKGIHLDRVRYPGPTLSYDTASIGAYSRFYNVALTPLPSNTTAAWEEMRRSFVNAGVREVHDSMRAVNPSLVLSAAVWPIYKIRSDWNQNSLKGWKELYQDPQAWALGGYLDVAVPMTYPGSATSESFVIKPKLCDNLDWLCMLDAHRSSIETATGRHMYIGVAAIKGWSVMAAEIEAARARGVTGMSVYSYNQVKAIPGSWDTLANGYFKYPATIPRMPWK